MAPNAHKLSQTAFRLPADLRAWLQGQAEREGRTMTEIVTDALEAYRDRA
jgi:predicted DNA-binding protein